ncbi:MAG: bifunctional N-acetylglucosamine-1-phosphate uridyltransferase/glucosamine-1-phosphate acetyltransferase [Alphaproteobacteria bacterium BRH_c36]|nr:MAG: bifunctional N-acetylglucosamine-1-phosphate uridyltransferase/glucosamine-1-phosphate acetyltransferase [Alphaproteobacteria bacterium BRH_c36]
MSDRPLLIVILAAGKGTRMKSAQPKVLHAVAGRSMLGHVLALSADLGAEGIAVVVGPDMEDVGAEVRAWAPDAKICEQRQQRGTADAVLAARETIAAHSGDVLVLYADTPLTRRASLEAMRRQLDKGAGVCVLGFVAADPTGYGRLLTDSDGALLAIREHKDASQEELGVRLCNSGVIGFRVGDLAGLLERIGNENAKGEFYLTDAVEIARGDGLSTSVVTCEEDEVLGVNSRDQLAAAEAIWQQRARAEAMAEGVTMVAPETVWLAYDTAFGRDVVVEPNVFFGPGVTIEDDVHIRANCYLEGIDGKSRAGLRIAAGAKVGPFARLRPGTAIGRDVHIGNFVEVKNATMEDGSKANHLSYVGDARVGAGANIGAGTIFCNYDGFNKNLCDVGAGVFIGSNSALVAPVKIGEGAYVAAGSTITRDVAPDSLAIARAAQTEKPQWAAHYRIKMAAQKKR